MTRNKNREIPAIRRATRADIPRIIGMVRALAEHHGDTPGTTRAAMERDLFGHQACATALIAVINGEPVGYALLWPFPHLQFGLRLMDLNHLYVDADHRGRGIGRQLIAAAVEDARKQGCGRLVVGTHPQNTRAQGLYQSLGFEAAHPAGQRFKLELPANGALPAGWI